MKKKRGLLFLMSVFFGGFLGGFVGMFKAGAESYEVILDVKVLIPWISTICLLLGFISVLLTFNFLRGMLARYLFPKQDNSKQTLIFLLLSSVLFALIHFPGDVQQFFVYFSLGFSLGLAYISRKGLIYSISLHALNNLIGFLMILML